MHLLLQENLSPGEKMADLTFSKKETWQLWCIGLMAAIEAYAVHKLREPTTKQCPESSNTFLSHI